MYRDVLTTKWIIGSIAFVIVFAGACYLWYQHETAPGRKAVAESAEELRRWETTQKADANSKVEYAADAPVESTTPTTETPITDTSDPVGDTAASTNKVTEPVNASKSETETADVRVSPHGFGPYPKIPPGYRAPNIFDKPLSKSLELMMRVDVKLWQQGIRTEGIRICYKSGLVYPNIQGTIYVRWEEFRLPDGKVVKAAFSMSGHSDTIDSLPLRGLPGIPYSPQRFLFESDIPSHITVLEDSEGIDPYEFLKEELK